MNMQSNLTLADMLKKVQVKFNSIVVITLLFVLIGVGITLALPKEYRGEAELVVIQKANPEIDSYTAQRSVESTVDLLVNLVYTDTFFTAFTSSDIDIRNRFPENIKERRRLFARNIIVESKGKGFISVATYDGSSEMALNQTKVVVTKLVEQAKALLGETATIQVVNQPSLYDGVGRPNILVNLLGSAILGLTVAFSYALTRRSETITYDFDIDEPASPIIPEDEIVSQIPPIINAEKGYDLEKF